MWEDDRVEVRFLAHHSLPGAFAAVRIEPSRDGEYSAEVAVKRALRV
jgi:hypothetical protein